jgi:hypothetical protein
MKKFKAAFILGLGVLIVGSLLFGQIRMGKIVGTVTDNEGIPLPGVSVECSSPNLLSKAVTITDANGKYRILGLPPGNYKIVFSLPGFSTVVRENIKLSIEETLTVNVEMYVAKIENEVIVVGKAPLIDVKNTTQGLTMDKKMFESLPTTSRNFDSLAALVPGVSNENRLGGTSVDGASGLENMYYIDGANTNNPIKGNVGQQVVYDFIDEVKTVTSGYQAEFGGSLGGVVKVITKSGGNEFHGSLITYYEASALNGKERDTLRLSPFDATKAEYVNYQDLYGKDKILRPEFGFDLGGYILKDKLWFYASFLPTFRNTTRHIEWQSGEISEGSYTQKYKWYNFMGKISANPFKGLRIFATVVGNPSSYVGSLPARDGSGDSSFPYSAVGYDYPNYSGSFSADLSLGNNLLVSTQIGYFMMNTTDQRLQPPGVNYEFWGETNAIYPDLVQQYPGYIRPAGWINYPSNFNYVIKDMFYSRTNLNGDLTWYFDFAGGHEVKAGFQWVKLISRIDNTIKYDYFQFQWGQSHAKYTDPENLIKGQYGVYYVFYAQPPLGPDVGEYGKAGTNNFALYFQDSWTIAKKLTINYGLRAERESIPAYSSDPKYSGKTVMTWNFGDKLAPRLGVVYDVFGDSSLKIYASYGIFYDVLKMNLAQSYYGAAVNRVNWYTLDDPRWWTYGNGNYPGTLIERFDWLLGGGAFETTDKTMKPMSQTEFSFGIEKKLAGDVSSSVRVVRKHLRRAIEDLGIFTPEGEVWWICNPGYGASLTQQHGGQYDNKYPDTPKAKREYLAVNLALDKRFSHNWMAGFSYTWSRLWGNYSGLAASEVAQLAPNTGEYFDFWWQTFDAHMKPLDGLLWTDRPHVFKLYGSYTFDFGLTLGIFSFARSGVPISRKIYIPHPLWPDGLHTDGRTPFLWTTDFLAQYTIKMGKKSVNFSLNITNLFNAKTATWVSDRLNRYSLYISDDVLLSGTFNYKAIDYVPDPRFLRASAFLDPISARLGIRFVF